mmetsp:Transcript_100172/g.198672  ORF Transcript_100172/g.198672 Transcript_100172/m.198672 type:complete len:129 (+) Transcript_100172:224-610(+)
MLYNVTKKRLACATYFPIVLKNEVTQQFSNRRSSSSHRCRHGQKDCIQWPALWRSCSTALQESLPRALRTFRMYALGNPSLLHGTTKGNNQGIKSPPTIKLEPLNLSHAGVVRQIFTIGGQELKATLI